MVYEQNLPVLCSCPGCVQSYLLPFFCRLRLCFLLPLIKITARIERPQMRRNWQRPRIVIHQSPHIQWPQFDHSVFWEVRSVALITGMQQTGVHVTVCLALNFRTHPHLTRRKKEENTKFWGRLVESVVFQKTVIKSTFDYGIEAKYKYWIVHFMNGLSNQQTKSFFRQWIH